MVTVPTSLFLVIYAVSTASATRLLGGPLRVVAAMSCVASVAVLAFSGAAVAVAVLVALIGFSAPMSTTMPREHDNDAEAQRCPVKTT
jgi:amino acid efflux transporter